MTGAVKPLGSVRFAPDKDVPCLFSALETGDPATGPSTWILKAPAGCVVPFDLDAELELWFSCLGKVTCMTFVTFDRPYDIRWGKT